MSAAAQTCDRAVALDRALPPQAKVVYLLLTTELDTYRYRPLKQARVAHLLAMRQPHVSRALRQLQERGYLDRGPRRGREPTWRLPASCALVCISPSDST